MRLALGQRLSLVFALVLLGCTGAAALMQWHAAARYEQEAIQRLSKDLAAQIASNSGLMGAGVDDPENVKTLFDRLMAVNPSVEVYLLDRDGRILGHAAPPDRLRHASVDLDPIRRLLAGAPLPVLGDDPRGTPASKVFSAAPTGNDRNPGWIYVILQGEAHDQQAARLAASRVWRDTAWSILAITMVGLAVGLAAFHWLTRRLRRLTESVALMARDGVVPAVARPLAGRARES